VKSVRAIKFKGRERWLKGERTSGGFGEGFWAPVKVCGFFLRITLSLFTVEKKYIITNVNISQRS
jgi:hypothetical protein